MKLFTSVVILLLCAGVSCVRTTAEKKNTVPRGVPGVNYTAIQDKSRSFSPAAGEHGGTITTAVTQDPETFNPLFARNTTSRQITAIMYAGLTRFDPVHGTVVPALAGSWEVSADSLVWTFRLRADLYWSDNTPLTAHDAAFTFNRIVLNDSIGSGPGRGLFNLPRKSITITAIDPLVLQVTLSSRLGYLLEALEYPVLPRHVFEKIIQSTPINDPIGTDLRKANTVGSGPFILASYAPSRKIVMIRNTKYWRSDSAGARLPYADSLILRIIPDQNEQRIAFSRGDLSVLNARPGDHSSLVEHQSDGNYRVEHLGPAGNGAFMVFNMNPGRDAASGRPYIDSIKRSWFVNPLFRRGVSHAIDRNGIIRTVFDGMGYPQWSAVGGAGCATCDTTLANSPFDTALARKTLKEGHFLDRNKDGILEDINGNRVAFTLATATGNLMRAKIGEQIVQNLSALGMKVELVTQEPRELEGSLTQPPFAWEAALVATSGNSDPLMDTDLWRSGGSLHLWHPKQSTPATVWERTIDSLLDRAAVTYSPAGRLPLRSAWQRIVTEQVPVVYTAVPERIICVSAKLGNINPSLTAGILDNIDEVFLIQQQSTPIDTGK